MSCDGIMVTDIWGAAALGYAGYEVSRIEIVGDRSAEIYFGDAPSEDAKIIIDDYTNSRLVLSDAKSYSLSFMRISRQISALRRTGATSWNAAQQHSDQWYATARKQLKERQAARMAVTP